MKIWWQCSFPLTWVHINAILDFHLLHSPLLFVLWFVTRHPSPPTSLRFWSALGWLVIMLMQLCSFKVSAPHPIRHHNHPPPSHLPAYHHQAPSLSVRFNHHLYVQCILIHLTLTFNIFKCDEVHAKIQTVFNKEQYLLNQFEIIQNILI